MKKKLNLFGNVVSIKTTLQGKFIVPPFSILDARQGYWQRRKRLWLKLGVQGELGRDEFLLYSDDKVMRDKQLNFYRNRKREAFELKRFKKDKWTNTFAFENSGVSVFDPVLCELMYKWFCPNNGKIFDPFAGESTKGIVASCLGYSYTGIELRQEQIEANEKQAKKIKVRPQWIRGDANNINKLLDKEDKYDLVFTSPPYFNLEIYSEQKKDGSTKQTYKEFMEWYFSIFKKTVRHLHKNRFLVVKVGEIRDKKTGAYHNFVGDNISCFLDLGLSYYNEIICLLGQASILHLEEK